MEELIKRKDELINHIVLITNNYNNTIEEKESLKKLYTELYLVIKTIKNKTGIPDDSLYMISNMINKTIYLFDFEEKRFDIKNPPKKKEYYSKEEALSIIESTVNNTREIIKDACSKHKLTDNYQGMCGMAQFASLYPLTKLGLKVTINNSYKIGGCSHAFGTVYIPVEDNGVIKERQYLIDCTYSQFFILSRNVLNYDDSSSPDPGYFIESEEEKEFAKSVIENGFFEVSESKLRLYLKGLYFSTHPLKDIEKVKDDFKNIDIMEFLNSKQVDFDYDESEFLKYGYDLNIEKKNKVM